MEIIKQVTGIDVSMDTLACCTGTINTEQQLDLGPVQTYNNNTTGIKKLYRAAQSQKLPGVSQYFLMEATGVYYEALAYFLKSKGAHIIVVLPNKAKHFAKTLAQKSKTDSIDAKMLTQMGLEKVLQEWEPPSEQMKALKQLTREHQQIMALLTQAKCRTHAKQKAFQPHSSSLKRLKQEIKFYQRQLEDIEAEILTLLKQDHENWNKVQNIQQVKGLSYMTIAKILAETDGFALIRNGKQLASYAGLDVVLRQSGKYSGKTTLSKRGNKYLRMSVYMPALSAMRSNRQMKAYYERILDKGKPKKVGIMAIARKMLLLVYYLWVNDTKYDPDYHPALQANLACF